MGAEHRLAHGVGPVVPSGEFLAERREPVGLVVDDGVATVWRPKHEVDAAGEIAPHVGLQRRIAEAGDVRPHRIVGVEMGVEQVADRRDGQHTRGRVAAGEGQLEGEFVDPIVAGDVAQADAADGLDEWCLDRGTEPGEDGRPVAEVDDFPGRLVGERAEQRGVEIAGGEVAPFEHAVHEGADLGAGPHGSERHDEVAQRGDAVAVAGDRVGGGRRRRRPHRRTAAVTVTVDGGFVHHRSVVCFAADRQRGGGVGVGGKSGVRGAPPRGVEGAVEQRDGEGRVARLAAGRPRPPDAVATVDSFDGDASGSSGRQGVQLRHRDVVGRQFSGGRHDAVGRAGEEQSAEARLRRAARRGPPHHCLMLGAGEGHIGQPQLFAPQFVPAQVVGVGLRVEAHVDRAATLVGGVVEERWVLLVEPALAPEVGAVDDGKLEALASIDGEHLHGLGVGLESPGAIVDGDLVVGHVHPGMQPRRQRVDAQLFGGRHLV